MKKFFMFMALTLILFAASAASVFALPPSPGEQWQGIDVSEWQGNINFKQVAASGIQVVYIRSSLGNSYIDPYFEQNYQKAKAAGLKIGFYHYVTARTVSQAKNQARFFVQVIQGKKFDCRLAMDFEDLTNLSAAQANKIGLAFIRETRKASGKKTVIYSNTYNARTMFSGALTKYPLWAAEYGASQPSSAVNWSSWAGWQYTDQGQVPGISGNVDRDIFTDAMFLKSSGNVKPTPTPPPSSDTIIYQVKAGDALWNIARQYHTSIEAIVQENNIANPNLIYMGERLKIPTSESSAAKTYVIRAGDTLWDIAQRYNTSVSRLASINNISNPNLIYPGEVIRLS